MPVSVLVATILAVGWNVVVLAVAMVTKTGPFAESTSDRSMTCRTDRVRADVGASAFDGQRTTQRQEAASGLSRVAASSEASPSATVEREVSYADASVTVATADGAEARRCSMCLN